MIWVILLVAFSGVGLLLISQQRMRRLDLPPGKAIYLDSASLLPQENSLFDPLAGITGRPDFLMQTRKGLVPVEAKSAKAPITPFPSHVYQLAAYCRLVESVYGKRPAFGVLKYRDRNFRIEYNPRLESSLFDLVAEVRRQGRREQERSHQSSARCRACGYRELCDQRID
jgi:CRISPR-associated exonuclease Cas4